MNDSIGSWISVLTYPWWEYPDSALLRPRVQSIKEMGLRWWSINQHHKSHASCPRNGTYRPYHQHDQYPPRSHKTNSSRIMPICRPTSTSENPHNNEAHAKFWIKIIHHSRQPQQCKPSSPSAAPQQSYHHPSDPPAFSSILKACSSAYNTASSGGPALPSCSQIWVK